LPWHYAAENGEQDKKQSRSPFSSASFYGKIGSTNVAVIVGFCGALPRAPTSSKEQKSSESGATFMKLCTKKRRERNPHGNGTWNCKIFRKPDKVRFVRLAQWSQKSTLLFRNNIPVRKQAKPRTVNAAVSVSITKTEATDTVMPG